ncbi:MAG: DUF4843 domain-containing protein [Prevotella sp.]|nr:DUF4843 domain-containing protein [Prevotella sp.]MBR5352011.1 DUF4843 domain-containing protein [Prevotella sp.]
MKTNNIKKVKTAMAALFVSLIPLASCLIISCENDPYMYQGTDAVWLSGDVQQSATTDSVLFSFKANGDIKETTMNLIVTLVGNISDKDRAFKLEVVGDETNVSAGDYEIGNTILPAGKRSVTIPVKIKRSVSSVDLTKNMAKLTLKVTPTDELIAGIIERSKYAIVWCDYLIKPDWWDRTIDYYIGSFTQAKYKFILDFANMTSYVFDDYSSIFGFQAKLVNLLNEYNSNPANANRPEGWPYLDDNGQPLRFGN